MPTRFSRATGIVGAGLFPQSARHFEQCPARQLRRCAAPHGTAGLHIRRVRMSGKKVTFNAETANFFKGFGNAVKSRNDRRRASGSIFRLPTRCGSACVSGLQPRLAASRISLCSNGQLSATMCARSSAKSTQRSFSLTGRLTYNLTPNLTVQYYGQPFIFRAQYVQQLRRGDRPAGNSVRGAFPPVFRFRRSAKPGTATFSVDENGDGATDYSFSASRTFNFIQFRSNLVVRWEYTPGSEFFLVWSQGATPNAFNDLDTPLAQSLLDNVFDARPTNILLAKGDVPVFEVSR
jgi:hypothetical protein